MIASPHLRRLCLRCSNEGVSEKTEAELREREKARIWERRPERHDTLT